MSVLFVVDRPQQWPFEIPGSSVVTARDYLTEPAYANALEAKVVNLCRVDRYQGRGYYVSLLAQARGHDPVPEVKAIGDLQSEEIVKSLAERLDDVSLEIRYEGSDFF